MIDLVLVRPVIAADIHGVVLDSNEFSISF